MLRNETTTERHRTHRTLTKKKVGKTKQKDDQKQQFQNLYYVLSTSRLTQVYNY